MPVRLESSYDATGTQWLRGNLHTHSTRSDGDQPPQEMIRAYADLGYDFLSLSDHDIASDYGGLDACGMVLIRGNEVSGGSPHMLDVGARRAIIGHRNHQALIDTINQAGGFAVICHPNWEEDFNHYSFEMIKGLQGYVGIEIFNGLVIGQAGGHLATDKWDRLLSTGRLIWGFANDDAHGIPQIARGWNVVQSAERTADAILAALRRGAFYASSGVRIEAIEVEGWTLRVVAPNADRIAVIGQHAKREILVDGPELTFDAARVGGPYIRVECYGRGGEMAWTQPFAIRGGAWDALQDRMKQMAAAGRSELRAYRASRAPEFTGRGDDPLWQKAEPFSAFIQIRDGSAPPVKTEVRCIVADGKLVFALRCDEPELEKLRLNTPGQGIWNAESVEIFLDVEGKRVSCYHMLINASGDAVAACRGPRQVENPAVLGKSGRYDQGGKRGWTAEMVVPLSELGVSADPGTRWGLHLCRNRWAVRGTYVWSWVGNSNHNKHLYGTLAL